MYEGGACDVRSMQRECNGHERGNFHGLLNGAQRLVSLTDFQTVSGNYLVVFSRPRFQGIRINFCTSDPFHSWKRFEHLCEVRSREKRGVGQMEGYERANGVSLRRFHYYGTVRRLCVF